MKKSTISASRKKKAFKLLEENKLSEAQAVFAKLCETNRLDAESWFMLGIICNRLDNYDKAEKYLDISLQLSPGNPNTIFNLGLALEKLNQLEKAAANFKQALTLKPDLMPAYDRLALVYIALGKQEEAIEVLREAIRMQPNSGEWYSNLGSTLRSIGRLSEALVCFEKALQLKPGSALIRANKGSVLCAMGRYDEAVNCYRDILNKNPYDIAARTNLLLTLNYIPKIDPAQVFAEHQRFGELCPAPVADNFEKNNRKKLRIGYVSPDFRSHSVAFFFEPLLVNHDSNTVEVYCYSSSAKTDDVTERLKRFSQNWRDITQLSDENAADLVRADKIDILVDLAGHTAGNRLGLFVRKPAPIQVTYLGYPNTTGLPVMDYRLTDSTVDTPEQDCLYTERLMRLPGSFICYQPLPDSPPITPLPALENKHIVFGSFNNLAKINIEVLRVWAEILKAVPNSRLLVKNPSLSDEDTKKRYYKLFSQYGIEDARLEFLGLVREQSDHLACYRFIDIALDTFPYNGTTTTCEALWMGVPVIVLKGMVHAGRVGAALLTHAGLSDWIADTPADYVSLASTKTLDRGMLSDLRQSLRNQLRDSTLCDGKRLAQDVEKVYWDMWHNLYKSHDG